MLPDPFSAKRGMWLNRSMRQPNISLNVTLVLEVWHKNLMFLATSLGSTLRLKASQHASSGGLASDKESCHRNPTADSPIPIWLWCQHTHPCMCFHNSPRNDGHAFSHYKRNLKRLVTPSCRGAYSANLGPWCVVKGTLKSKYKFYIDRLAHREHEYTIIMRSFFPKS